MATYIGFSSINASEPRTTSQKNGGDGPGTITEPIVFGKKFKMVDSPLVVRDFLNALNIRRGEKVGNPSYGTSIWDFVFEPNTVNVQQALEEEIRRVATLDPRLMLNRVNVYARDNGILVQIELSVTPFNEVGDLSLLFDSTSNTAQII